MQVCLIIEIPSDNIRNACPTPSSQQRQRFPNNIKEQEQKDNQHSTLGMKRNTAALQALCRLLTADFSYLQEGSKLHMSCCTACATHPSPSPSNNENQRNSCRNHTARTASKPDHTAAALTCSYTTPVGWPEPDLDALRGRVNVGGDETV